MDDEANVPEANVPEADDQDWKDHRFDEYALAVGWIAGLWSQIEAGLDEAIWELANVEIGPGACITSHIGSIGGRIRAFMSLIDYRGATTEQAKYWNGLFVKVEGLGRRRNRFVHDAITIGGESGILRRRQVTADRKLVFDYLEADLAQMKDLQNELRSTSVTVHESYQKLANELPPWRHTPREQRPANFLLRRLPQDIDPS
ncbi:hypothetical protein [Acidisoma cladoniae]|jgi:hypothetical protein|uniref:hypothetical protein n=1 Tax=Acidisoma cladoniae TaxID=3040935 RepID=UPI00254BC7D3|nr:hypothetical protein [Acidisoma sp. PAMC 29798]